MIGSLLFEVGTNLKPEDTQGAPCLDCGKDTQPMHWDGRPLFGEWDIYIARGDVWAEAGMDGWDSGYLCSPCLGLRLGREPRPGIDLLVWRVGAKVRCLEVRAHPDYFTSSEYLEH